MLAVQGFERCTVEVEFWIPATGPHHLAKSDVSFMHTSIAVEVKGHNSATAISVLILFYFYFI